MTFFFQVKSKCASTFATDVSHFPSCLSTWADLCSAHLLCDKMWRGKVPTLPQTETSHLFCILENFTLIFIRIRKTRLKTDTVKPRNESTWPHCCTDDRVIELSSGVCINCLFFPLRLDSLVCARLRFGQTHCCTASWKVEEGVRTMSLRHLVQHWQKLDSMPWLQKKRQRKKRTDEGRKHRRRGESDFEVTDAHNRRL